MVSGYREMTEFNGVRPPLGGFMVVCGNCGSDLHAKTDELHPPIYCNSCYDCFVEIAKMIRAQKVSEVTRLSPTARASIMDIIGENSRKKERETLVESMPSL
jgi:hypothetical protein